MTRHNIKPCTKQKLGSAPTELDTWSEVGGKALFLIFFQPSMTTGLQGLDTLSSASQGFLLTLGNEHLLGTLCIIPGQMVGPFMLHLCLESLFCVQHGLSIFTNTLCSTRHRHSCRQMLMKKKK